MIVNFKFVSRQSSIIDDWNCCHSLTVVQIVVLCRVMVLNNLHIWCNRGTSTKYYDKHDSVLMIKLSAFM